MSQKENKEKQVNKEMFIARKLGVMNQKTGAKYERNAVRIVENNK